MAEQITYDWRHMTRTGAADVKTRDISSDILLRQPQEAVMYTLVSKLGSRPTKQIKYEAAEDEDITPYVTVNHGGGYDSSASTETFQLDSNMAQKVRPGAVLMYGEEKFLCRDSNRGTDVVVLTRGHGSTTRAAVPDDAVLVIVQEGFEEGSQYTDGISREIELEYNYAQEMEEPISMTNIQMITEDYTKWDWDHQCQMAMRRYKFRRERTFWAGVRALGTGPNGRRIAYTGGMDEFIPSANKTTVTGLLTKRMIEQSLLPILTYGDPNQILGFVGTATWNAISQIADSYVEIPRSENTLGLTINKIVINGRTVKIVENQQFDKMLWTNRIYWINMACVSKRYLSTSKGSLNTQWVRNIQENDRKGRKDVIYGVEGLQRRNAYAHACLKGFST